MVQRSPGNPEALRILAPNFSLNQREKNLNQKPITWKVPRELKRKHATKKNIYTHQNKKKHQQKPSIVKLTKSTNQ